MSSKPDIGSVWSRIILIRTLYSSVVQLYGNSVACYTIKCRPITPIIRIIRYVRANTVIRNPVRYLGVNKTSPFPALFRIVVYLSDWQVYFIIIVLLIVSSLIAVLCLKWSPFRQINGVNTAYWHKLNKLRFCVSSVVWHMEYLVCRVWISIYKKIITKVSRS